MDLKFNHLASLHWLWLVFVLAAVLMTGLWLKRRALRRFAAAGLLDILVPDLGTARPRVRIVLLILAMVALVAAMIDPRWGLHVEQLQRRGLDIVFAVDVSRSMLAEDVAPNRLARAKQSVVDVLDKLGGDRVALVTFAGVSGVKCPLTLDYGAFRLSLDEIDPDSQARGGSLIGDAIRFAQDCFVDDVKENKAIIVLTDGEDQDSYPVEAAQQAFEQRGIRIYTVGIGDSAQGARIPVVESGQKHFLLYQGQEVWSKMNPSLLRDVAVGAGGAFVPAGTTMADLGEVYEQKIAAAGKAEAETTRIERYTPRYQWFAGLALLLLLVESLMSDRKGGRRREIQPVEPSRRRARKPSRKVRQAEGVAV